MGAIVIGLVARDAIETAFLQRAFASAIGGEASIGALRHGVGTRILDDVRLRTGDGALTVTAEHVILADRGGALAVDAAGVRAVIATDRVTGDELGRLGTLGGALGSDRVTARVRNAVADVARSDGAAPTVRLAGITATATRDGGSARYDVQLMLTDATGAYPIHGAGAADAGRAEATWTAPRLPVGSLVALLPQNDLVVRAGTAHDVALALHPGASRLTLTLDGIAGTLGEQELHGVAGPLVVTEDGLGTDGITGTVGTAVPLTLSGEVHDAAGWTHLLAGDSHDLHALVHLFEMMASQANVRWLKLETTAPGVTFGQYAMTTKDVPHVVQLLAVNPREPTLRFGTALAHDHIISHGERTSIWGSAPTRSPA